MIILDMCVKYSHGSTEYVSRSWNALPGNLCLGFAVAALEVRTDLPCLICKAMEGAVECEISHKRFEIESFLFF